jgi:hypothetical protein
VSAALQLDPLKLFRADLDARMTKAIERAEEIQRERGQPFEVPPGYRGFEPVELGDGVVFIPDGSDAKKGAPWQIIGAVAGVFGLALLGVYLEGDQAEPWMRWAGPMLAIGGGGLWWHGTQTQKKTLPQARITGAYLFPELLLHVGTVGCRLFPRERVRGFDCRSMGDPSGARSRYLFIAVELDDGKVVEKELFYRDSVEPLTAWLED